MPSLSDVKKRISSVTNTKKTTAAMKMVSAAKIRRFQERYKKSKSYRSSFDDTLDVAMRKSEAFKEELSYILNFSKKEPKKPLYVVMASDRGLCGGLNTNVLKEFDKCFKNKKDKDETTQVVLWGTKSFSLVKNKKENLDVIEKRDSIDSLGLKPFKSLAELVFRGLRERRWDSCFIIYTCFNNMVSQVPVVKQIAPISITQTNQEDFEQQEALIKPLTCGFYESILKQTVINSLYEAHLSSSCSEHASRMTAMENATKNAGEMIDRLTLDYNKQRQANITRELIEITSGAEAL